MDGNLSMSNLRDVIRQAIERQNLGKTFTVEDVRGLLVREKKLIGGQEYDTKHIGSILSNHSIGPGARLGEAAKRGGARLFIKHKERATYSINYVGYIPESEDAADLLDDEKDSEQS